MVQCNAPVWSSSLWCAVRVTGSCSQAALSGKLRSRQAALTVTVPSIKPAGSIQPLESRLENRNNLEIRNISRFIFYYYWNSKIVIIIDLLLCTRNNIRILKKVPLDQHCTGRYESTDNEGESYALPPTLFLGRLLLLSPSHHQTGLILITQ